MIDTHYDLLSIAYVAYLKGDYSYLEKVSKYFHDKNVTGVIANLYFMSEEEMAEELHSKYYQKDVSVLEMFVKAKEVLDTYLSEIDILYSIEGVDFVSGPFELERLCEAGLDAIIPAWNTQSRYASGNRSNQGLTALGRELLSKAIDLGLGIDLSHANEATFKDIIDLVEEEKALGREVVCYASHSNSRSLCSRSRNLFDYQLKMIRNIGGQVGVFANRNFIVTEGTKDVATQEEKEKQFLEHVMHVAEIVGKDNVMIATDDMDFCKDADSEYGEVAIYEYSRLADGVLRTLSQEYDLDEISMIMQGTAKEKVFKSIKDNKKRRGVK